MRHGGKRIYSSFRISNQIFSIMNGSGDIARSLDTTFTVFTVFGQNLDFVDEYLENGNFLDMRFSRGAQNSLVLHSDQVSSKSFEPFSRKSQDNPASSLFSFYHCLTSCKVS